MGKTSIEWTDHSWPVINGCRRVSAGCENCYAERLTATRLSKTPKYAGLAVMRAAPGGKGPPRPRWTGEARLWAPHLAMPLKLKKPSRIFVCDMGDLFYEGVSDEEIAAVFGVMAACPRHVFQVLTKRPERAREWFRWAQQEADAGDFRGPVWPIVEACARNYLEDLPATATGAAWPLPNVWLGVSVEDQASAHERIPVLLDIPAALRFVSAEPMLGPVELNPWLRHSVLVQGGKAWLGAGIDWVITGGESGPGARPCAMEWLESVVIQCEVASVPCFVKQLGAVPVSTERVDNEGRWAWQAGFKDRKGGDMEEWPEDLRVREFPTERLNHGRLVDGAGRESTDTTGA